MTTFGEAALRKARRAAEDARKEMRHTEGPVGVSIAVQVISAIEEVAGCDMGPRDAAYLRSLLEMSRQRIAEDARRDHTGG